MNNKIFRLEEALLPKIAVILKTLGHPIRLRILEALVSEERCVSDLTGLLGLSQAVISQQLKIMRTGDVLVSRRMHTRVFYRLANPNLVNLLNCLVSCQKLCHP